MLRYSREDRGWREYPLQLEILTQKLGTMPDSEVKVSGLRSLGLALQIISDGKSQQILEQSLAIALEENFAIY
ncbi:hypothetical protein [Nostoc sp. NZL]|uniref:hypothetical protein n=1 Tax=Nostoc sp. NZL TaxID=2650612 RepID=UPI0018C53C48|nr:hypothetical protein [Nostoc sp. NZL]MBG1241221.1 hypothetical protein [Nostoc sp. NZL]